MKTTLKQIMKFAWKLYRANIFAKFGDALRAAWRQAKIGYNHVTFQKKSGEWTTRRVAILSKYYTPKGSDRKPTTTLKFADLDKIEDGLSNFVISFNPEQVLNFV